MAELVGKQIDRYLVLAKIGEGGMAVVYRARNTRLDSQVAMKFIRIERLAPEVAGHALKRFEREAKSLARLTHSNIVGVMDYGDHEGQPYLVMEYLSGGSVRDFMGKAMPWQEAVRLLLPVAHALQYVHKHNIVHRDIKPSNILLTESGQPMLADFGIAKILEEEITVDLTGTRGTIGTPEYMSPEQGLGKEIDFRSDIYSLGVVFFELVTGRKPFLGDTPMETLFQHVNAPLPNPTTFVPNLPATVARILLKSLAKKRDDRYATMTELIDVLEDASREKPVSRRQTIDASRTQTAQFVAKERKPKISSKPVYSGLWLRVRNAVKSGAQAFAVVGNRLKSSTLNTGGKLLESVRPIWGWLVISILAISLLIFLMAQIPGRIASQPTSQSITQNGNISGVYFTSGSAGNEQVRYFDPGNSQQIIPLSDQDHSWSAVPDGQGNLFFVSDKDGEVDIYMRTASGETKRMTRTMGKASSWSPAPDGYGNLYYVSDRSGEIDIYIFTAGGETKRMTRTMGKASSWSPAPDGHGNLYYVSDRSGEIDIYVFTVGGETKRMTRTMGKASSWSPAPDGDGNLYYVSDRSGEIDIYVFTVGGETRRMTTTMGTASSWMPAPDGRGNFYFISNRSGETALYIFKPGQETQQVALTLGEAASWLRDPSDFQIQLGN